MTEQEKLDKLDELREEFEGVFLNADHIVEELDSGFLKITKSKYDTLRRIKETSLQAFHKRFSPHRLEGSKRQRTRQLEAFLDKRGVKTWAPSSEKMGYFILIPGQARALWCDVSYNEDKQGYNYTFTEVDKHGNFEGF